MGVPNVKESAWCGRHRFYPGVRKIHWRKEIATHPIFLPGEFHGQATVHGVTKSQT